MKGHAGHPEVIGTMGQLPAGEVLLVETVADVAGGLLLALLAYGGARAARGLRER